MKITDAKKGEAGKNPHGVDVRRIYDTENAQVMHITLQPGESLRKHVTPVDAFFYILEGTATVEIGEEIVDVPRDSMVESPKEIPHSIQNRSEGIVRVLVAKVPRQTADTKVLSK